MLLLKKKSSLCEKGRNKRIDESVFFIQYFVACKSPVHYIFDNKNHIYCGSVTLSDPIYLDLAIS
jgi:hypothetical protein